MYGEETPSLRDKSVRNAMKRNFYENYLQQGGSQGDALLLSLFGRFQAYTHKEPNTKWALMNLSSSEAIDLWKNTDQLDPVVDLVIVSEILTTICRQFRNKPLTSVQVQHIYMVYANELPSNIERAIIKHGLYLLTIMIGFRDYNYYQLLMSGIEPNPGPRFTIEARTLGQGVYFTVKTQGGPAQIFDDSEELEEYCEDLIQEEWEYLQTYWNCIEMHIAYADRHTGLVEWGTINIRQHDNGSLVVETGRDDEEVHSMDFDSFEIRVIAIVEGWDFMKRLVGIELNPGPTFSRDQRQPWIYPLTLEQEVFKQQKRKLRREQLVKQNKPLEQTNNEYTPEWSMEEEFVSKQQQQRARCKQHRELRLERDYRSKHKVLKYTSYTGNMKDDLSNFCEYVEQHGWAVNPGLPPSFIQSVFEKWARTGNLVAVETAKAVFRRSGRFVVDNHFRPQYKSRKLLLKAFVANSQVAERFSYLRIFIARTTRMPNSIGVTLKDVCEVNRKMKIKKYKWEDFSMAKKQMMDSKALSASVRQEVIEEDRRKKAQSCSKEEQETWFGGLMRTAGAKLAQGMQDVVVPVLERVGSTVRDYFQCYQIWKLVGLYFGQFQCCYL